MSQTIATFRKISLAAAFLLLIIGTCGTVKVHAEEAQDPNSADLNMKTWVESTVDGLRIRTCPQVSADCPLISDPGRPSLKTHLNKGWRTKVLYSRKTEDPESCIEGNCTWYKTDLGWIHSFYTRVIAHPEPANNYECPYDEDRCVLVQVDNFSFHLIQKIEGEYKDVFRTWTSTGRTYRQTPRLISRVWYRTESQSMGCKPGYDYCLQNVAYSSFFKGSYGFHGTHWHHEFGLRNKSSGCVNLTIYDARVAQQFAPLGTVVVVR